MKVWIKNNYIFVVVIIMILSILGFIGTILYLNRDSIRNSMKENNNSSSNTLPNGKYNCELMYDGESLENDYTFKEWVRKLVSYDNTIKVNGSTIGEVRKNFFSEIGTFYINKDDDSIKLYVSNYGLTKEFLIYDIKNNKYSISNEWNYDNGWKDMENIFNSMITIKQNDKSLVYENYGIVILYPSIYNSKIKNNESVDNIDVSNYTGLGDLVCKVK